MTAKDLRAQIHDNLSLRETEDLIEIWQTNDRTEMSDLAFEVIEQILRERLGELPTQGEAITEESKARSKDEAEREETDAEGRPDFYDPQAVLRMSDLARVLSWVALALWGLKFVVEGRVLFEGVNLYDGANLYSIFMMIITYALSAAISFFTFQGFSYGLNILMEFEFNTRGAK